MVSPLLPILLPLVVAAIVLGGIFAWLFPPVPAGGEPPLARFTDVTAESGLTFVQRTGITPEESPTTLGGGVAVFDCDGDGDEDLFFVNGAPWPWEEPMAKRVSRNGCALFRNDGLGHFTDISASAEVNVELQGMAAAAGDFDDDGLPDLYVTCIGANHLFHNRGGGRFEDVTDDAGVGGEENTWSTGATWIDYDGDGRLDLIVCHYARWPREVELQLAFTVAAVGRSYGAPTGFVGAFPSVYRNLGGGRFALVPDSAGVRVLDAQTGLPAAKALAVVPADGNGDGRLDLLFSYQLGEDAFFLNQGDGSFRRWSAAIADRPEGASAGLAVASPWPFLQATGGDERLAAWQALTALRSREHADNFMDLAAKRGAAVFDYDGDGRLDFFSGAGRAEADVNHFEHGRDFAAVPQLLWNRGDKWIAAPMPGNAADSDWARALVARGVASGDFDGDGDVDVIVTQYGGPPQLLRNDQRVGLPWLQIALIATRGAREAGGARVEVHTPRRVWMQTAAPAMGLMAQSSATLFFGLGDDARVRRVVVHWPDGARQEIVPEAINRRLVITER